MSGRVRRTILAGAVTAVVLGACSGGSDADLEAFCSAIAERERFEATFDGLDPTDVDAALAAFGMARDTQDDLLAVAPDGARDDLEIVAAFIDDLIAGLDRAEPDTDRPDVYDQLRPRFDEVEAAGDRLDLFVAANC